MELNLTDLYDALEDEFSVVVVEQDRILELDPEHMTELDEKRLYMLKKIEARLYKSLEDISDFWRETSKP